jgi:hypothetical protein
MGKRNYLVEGVSGSGKTSVCDELQRRGYEAIHGDRELAYQGDPETGVPTENGGHENHIWRVDQVEALTADHTAEATFFCGGSRNFDKFIHLFDATAPIVHVVDDILRRCELIGSPGTRG